MPVDEFESHLVKLNAKNYNIAARVGMWGECRGSPSDIPIVVVVVVELVMMVMVVIVLVLVLLVVIMVFFYW